MQLEGRTLGLSTLTLLCLHPQTSCRPLPWDGPEWLCLYRSASQGPEQGGERVCEANEQHWKMVQGPSELCLGR